MIKNLIFDFGGVLSVSHHSQAVQRFKELGVPNTESYFVEGRNWGGIFGEVEDGSISPDSFLQEVSKLCGKPISFEQIAYAWWGFHSYLPQGLTDWLRRWRNEGYKLYMLSNNNPFMMSYISGDSFAPDDRPFRTYFDKLYVSCELGLSKPNKEIYQFVIDDQKIKPEETIFVDDRQQNLTGASAVGMHTHFVSNNEHWMEDFNSIIKKIH